MTYHHEVRKSSIYRLEKKCREKLKTLKTYLYQIIFFFFYFFECFPCAQYVAITSDGWCMLCICDENQIQSLHLQRIRIPIWMAHALMELSKLIGHHLPNQAKKCDQEKRPKKQRQCLNCCNNIDRIGIRIHYAWLRWHHKKNQRKRLKYSIKMNLKKKHFKLYYSTSSDWSRRKSQEIVTKHHPMVMKVRNS